MCNKQLAGTPKEEMKMKKGGKGTKGKDGKSGNRQLQQESKVRQQGKLAIDDIIPETLATTTTTATGVCSFLKNFFTDGEPKESRCF